MTTNTKEDRLTGRRRAAVVGVLAALAVAGGSGVAFAADGHNPVIESGYGAVVNENPASGTGAACRDRAGSADANA